ncbi:ABC transporter permease [candidate division KSB1 bacterium]|nr:ABC transporter permease [candidate division KSB1 bacterium]
MSISNSTIDSLLFNFRKLASVFSLLLIVLVLSILSPDFLKVDNLLTVGLQISPRAIMAIGQVVIIITAGIDLSVGSVMALSGVITGLLLASGINIYLAAFAGIGVGTFCGFLNGAMVSYGKLPPFIATLGMMGMARGVALIATGGVPIFDFPPEFAHLSSARLGGIIPLPVIITCVLGTLFYLAMVNTSFGRYSYAIGGNMEATRLSGVNVKWILLIVYAAAGLLYGIAGLIEASRLSTGQPTAGTGYELDVIAACVIGGTSLSGGVGTIWGALIGSLVIGFLRNGCNLLDISNFWQQVAIGAIIVIAVFIDQLQKNRTE